MSSVKIDFDQIMRYVDRYVEDEDSPIRPIARKLANNYLKRQKKEFLDEFDENLVTQELVEGSEDSRIQSSILPFGNLFSFLGFVEHYTPAQNLRSFLNKFIQLEFTPTYNKNLKRFYFKYNLPDREDIVEATESDLPWGTFDSWVYAIEDGIDNLNQYLYDATRDFNGASQSGPAIQIKGVKNPGLTFGGIPYLTAMLDHLENQLNK